MRRRQRGPIGGPGVRRGVQTPQGGRHVGIICDGCNTRDFTGVRYKCLNCPDFDFCAACHSNRSALHPGHDFETIATPRSVVPPFLADFLARAAARTSIAIISTGLGVAGEQHSGLDDERLAWWLAHSRRLVRLDQIASEDPPWSCPICAEGVEAEEANGWVVQICGKPLQVPSSTPSSPSNSSSPSSPLTQPSPPALALPSGPGSRPEPLGPHGPGPITEGGAAEAPGAKQEPGSGKDYCLGTEDAEEPDPELQEQAHVYHETCLRRWLVKSNSCPVCRRSPVVPAAEA